MEGAAVFRALGNPTRYSVYAHVAGSGRPRSTAEVAAALGLHPNTVRPHLERLREAGLLSVERVSRGTVGRPQHRYQVALDVPGLDVPDLVVPGLDVPGLDVPGLGPPALPLLAGLLAELADTGPEVVERARALGRRRGELIGRRRRPRPAPRGGVAPALRPLVDDPGGRPAPALGALMDELAILGFDPVLSEHQIPEHQPSEHQPSEHQPSEHQAGARAGPERSAAPPCGEAGPGLTVTFARCPYRDLAEEHPEVVCHLHRGLMEGMVEAMGGLGLDHFATLADRDPCRAELVVR